MIFFCFQGHTNGLLHVSIYNKEDRLDINNLGLIKCFGAQQMLSIQVTCKFLILSPRPIRRSTLSQLWTIGPEKSNTVGTGLQHWGCVECHISFFPEPKEGASSPTLLFKETFGEYVLKDSAKPFSCIHCLILKPCHEMGIIIFTLYMGQPRLKEFLELIQAFTKTSRALWGPRRQTTRSLNPCKTGSVFLSAHTEAPKSLASHRKFLSGCLLITFSVYIRPPFIQGNLASSIHREPQKTNHLWWE